MSIIVIDGCEKAGKSTVIKALVSRLEKEGIKTYVRNWGLINPDDRVYAHPLYEDTTTIDSVTIWDRSWASEYVYSTLLPRNRRLREDAWLGEWLHGRATQANGYRIMLLGPDVATLTKLRDDTDLPVDPRLERDLFRQYANSYGWDMVENKHSKTAVTKVVNRIMKEYKKLAIGPLPPYYCGIPNASVIFVSSKRVKSTIPGGWLPFTNRASITFGRLFSYFAFRAGWTIAHEVSPVCLRRAKVLVACGQKAQLWIKNYVIKEVSNIQCIDVPHLFHWSKTHSVAEVTRLNDLVNFIQANIIEYGVNNG